MENPEAEEPERRRPQPIASPADNRTVDASVLHYENQKLVQQLDIQKHELHDLEANIKGLRKKQTSYDDTLIKVNQRWNQLVDDLVLLGARAGGAQDALKILVAVEDSRGCIPSSPPEDIFLCRLLQTDSIASTSGDGIIEFVEEALALRKSSTFELMKLLEDTIGAESSKTMTISQNLQARVSAEVLLLEIDKMMKEEAKSLHEAIDVLHLKHKEYAEDIQIYVRSHSEDASEIKRLEGELEESMAVLEESRRKLINLRMQMDVASGAHIPAAGSVHGNSSPEKPGDKMLCLRELKDSIEEKKILAADRLSELQDAQEYNATLSKQLQDVQSELKDEKYVLSSRFYTLVNDQLQHFNAEVERYKTLTDSLQFQADRSFVIRREKELNAKLESTDAARNAIDTESRLGDLELQLQKCISEKNDLEIKMEEANQDSGRKDIKSEFRVMVSALSREMGMMEVQLNRWKDTAHEALLLREKTQSLKASITIKSDERKRLADRCTKQKEEIKSIKELIEKLQKEKLELQIFLDLYGNESYDNRDIADIRESERRALSQAEVLKNALEEHSLELRVKAANEAEVACQQRLSAAEAEIAELRAKLDASERDASELAEAIKIKDAEAEAYISEIETIGQAYEDMQTQNQHLLQQVTERDDYNIKLVSDSVKTKQAQNSLLSEKQALVKELEQVNSSVESLKLKISHGEEQMKVLLSEAMKSSQEDRHFAISLEGVKSELGDAEKELKWLKSVFASSEKEYDQLQWDLSEIQMKLDNEREERKKLEEEIVECNKKVAELTAESGEAAVKRLQDEIKDCRAMLKCSVCLDRPKEVVIVKCFHLFCNQCIQRNLEIRHRKCPGCGTAFGQNDVHFVKM
ncbi:E3 ubiquitin-protein ligase BRE1-like 2 isoform X1 [Syzygium oleosum]|uniref:E3 ubiquitin-protein ligase BRE1-like 2 isoform X1 n=2 Tax=Syzygium oleosum TaxID=219896 RepID=UPI0024B950C1|nr:E3 ubiquitin-protein ligase BRE1-like 2 isoform X1 [Syzygium oleosum]